MAKKPNTEKPKDAAPQSVTVTYDLFDLPTAQHKAGLAGMLLQIRHMEARNPKPPTIPKIVELTATSAKIEFNAEMVQALFDDVYAAEWAEAKVKSKWAGAELVREETTEEVIGGKKKTIKLYVYRIVQPTGPVLKQFITNAPDLWLKLWRDMLWQIPRGYPQSRQPFLQRADQAHCKEGSDAWLDLERAEKARTKNQFVTAEVAGTLWLGAQAVNAENIPFEGRVEHTLLLHFWPVTALVYAPQILQPDGTSEFVGYVLAIPEASDLQQFVADYPRLLGELGKEARGYRPAEAVIDLPAEGALSFLEHLARLAQEKAAGSEIRYAIGSIEFLHLAKIGNNIKTMAAGRVTPKPYLLERYIAIVGRAGQKPRYGNPLFRRGLMLALLNDIPWFHPFGKLFAEWPAEFFVNSEKSPKNLSWFSGDSRKKIQEVIQSMPSNPQPNDPLPDTDDLLMTLVHRLVRTYLSERAKAKSGIDPDKFKVADKIDWEKIPPKYSEERRKAGESLFLEFRSRRDQAFVQHFSQTLFAAKQFLSEDQCAEIGRALLRRTDDVKTLTLMALSANS